MVWSGGNSGSGPQDPDFELYFHAIRDPSAIYAPNQLVQFAAQGFLEMPGPLSPDIYWWRAGAITRLGRTWDFRDPQKRRFEWTMPPAFVNVMKRRTGAQ